MTDSIPETSPDTDLFPVEWGNPEEANRHWGFDLYYEPFVQGFSDDP